MASGQAQRIALMSIHPRFAEQILSGRKRVEFRKKAFSAPVSHVVIYSTSPVRRVVGFFEVAGVEEGSPSGIWERYKGVGGIARKLYRKYFSSHRNAVAIKVGGVFPLSDPLPLEDIDSQKIPPQSFRYLEQGTLRKMVKMSSDVCWVR